jgi:hypothetical protein
MYLKLLKMVFFILRQEHLITRAPKSGRINPMTRNQISGHLDALYTKWPPLSLHSELRIWMVCTKK